MLWLPCSIRVNPNSHRLAGARSGISRKVSIRDPGGRFGERRTGHRFDAPGERVTAQDAEGRARSRLGSGVHPPTRARRAMARVVNDADFPGAAHSGGSPATERLDVVSILAGRALKPRPQWRGGGPSATLRV